MRQEDRELVRQFVEAIRPLSEPEAARETGISQTTINRWKRGDLRPISKRVRRKVEEYLKSRERTPAAASDEFAAGVRHAAGELVLTLERLRRFGPPEVPGHVAPAVRALIEALERITPQNQRGDAGRASRRAAP